MEVGDQSQTVEVSATAAPLLQTDSAVVGGLISNEAVQDLPVNGRNFIKLVQLAPGANEGPQSSLSGGTRPDDRRLTSTVSANGQTDTSNNYLLDGMDNNERMIGTIIVKPSIDSLQEVKVDTNLFSADTGRVGGAVINMITKSGTNTFHGQAFEFFRNDLFDAKDFLNVPQPGNPLAGKKPEFRQNQFGAGLGGPIRKNKTFFFADYEGLRIIQGKAQSTIIPTACNLTGAGCPIASTVGGLPLGLPGNFSDQLPQTVIYNPATGLPFPNNIIPKTSLDPIAVDYAELYPVVPKSGCSPSNGLIVCPFVASPNKTQYFHTADVRIDEHVDDKNSFFARYTINNGDSTFPGPLPVEKVAGVIVAPGGADSTSFPGSNYGRQQSILLSYDHIFQPNLLLDMHASVARYVSLSVGPNAGINVNTAFGGPVNGNVPTINGVDGLLQAQFDNYGFLGDTFALPTDYWDTNFQIAGALTWNKGSHNFKFGSSLLRRTWSTYQIDTKGIFTFTADPTSGPAGNGGIDLASMLTGNVTDFERFFSLVSPQYRDWEIAEFAQDNWRVAHWFTLNLGLRYDIFTPFTEKHGFLSNFDPTNPAVLTSGQMVLAGRNNASNTGNIPTQYNMFQPRIGFAATLGHDIVLRGGIGTTYYPENAASPANLQNQPFATTFGMPNGTTFNSPLPVPSMDPSLSCLVPKCGADPTSTNEVDQGEALNIRNSIIYMYNLTLEKAFGANDVSLGWVGEPGRNLGRIVNNVDLPLPPNAPGSPAACNRAVNKKISLPSPCQPYFGQLPLTTLITLLESNGSNSYNALNAIFQRRYNSGLTIQANYTWARGLANTGGPGGPCDTCGLLPNNPRSDWGNSDYDVRHRVAVSVNYELPFGELLKGFSGQVVKGWQVNGIYSFESGLPFTVDDSHPAIGIAGINRDRPNVLLRQPFVQSAREWFNTSDFVAQSWGTTGNEERNQFFAPAEKKLDLSLFKDFPIRESLRLQFRTEVFNLTNTPIYALARNANRMGSATFGQLTSNAFYTPRDIQFALKLLF